MFRAARVGFALVIACSAVEDDSAAHRALLARGAARTHSSSLLGSLVGKQLPDKIDRSLAGKECSFCVQSSDFKTNFDTIADAISGVASDVKDVQQVIQKMSPNLTKPEQQIANDIKALVQNVNAHEADMLKSITAMRSFLDSVKSEIDLSALVTELQTSIARITHRQSLLKPLMSDKGALTPEQRQQLVTAVLDINEGSDIDTQVIHDVLTGEGGVVPGVEPALEVYKKKGYRLQQLAQVFGALFVYQMHGYGQLFWADLNKRPHIEVLSYGQSRKQAADRLQTQWQNFAAPFMWHCYWNDGYICSEFQECEAGLRGLGAYACNHATAPVSIDTSAGTTSFTLGAASSQLQLQLKMDAPTGTCIFGLHDCAGQISAPLASNGTSNFSCTAAATVELEGGIMKLFPQGKAGGPGKLLANVSASNASSYALYVNETGEIAILGDNHVALWTHPAPTPPASGICPTDFTKRELKAISLDSCSCITTARWRRVAVGRTNMTASWCGRLCQADPQFVASAPRADGECWCGTPEVYKQQVSESANCKGDCPFCPGAPIEACGVDNSLAIYKWGSGTEEENTILL